MLKWKGCTGSFFDSIIIIIAKRHHTTINFFLEGHNIVLTRENCGKLSWLSCLSDALKFSLTQL